MGLGARIHSGGQLFQREARSTAKARVTGKPLLT